MAKPEPVRGKEPRPDVGSYGRTVADDNIKWAGDYLHTNEYLAGPTLQAALNRMRRRREMPGKAGRGGLSRQQWRRMIRPGAAGQQTATLRTRDGLG